MKTTLIFLFLSFISLSAHASTLQATKKAAVEGEPRAQYDMAIRYLKGDGVEKSSADAIEWLKKANEQGYSSAQYKLGVLYRDGRKVDTDLDQAIEYFTLAADQGNPIAQYALGNIYQQGNGVAQDLDEAQEWFELAAGHGLPKAQKALDRLDSIINSEAANTAGATTVAVATPVAILESTSTDQPTAETTQAAHEKGMQYLTGDGVDKDYTNAAKWFSQAAEQGYAKSQYRLGELLKKGKGVKRNKKLADKWYRAAAKQGHIKAKNRLSGCGFC